MKITDLSTDDKFVLCNYGGSWFLEKVFDAYGVSVEDDEQESPKTYMKIKSSHETSVPIGKNFMTKLMPKIKRLQTSPEDRAATKYTSPAEGSESKG